MQVRVLFNYLLMPAVKADEDFFPCCCGFMLAVEGPLVFSFACEWRLEKPQDVIEHSINMPIDWQWIANISKYNRANFHHTPTS